MAKTNTERSRKSRDIKATDGLKELRHIWVQKSISKDAEKELKAKIKELIKQDEQSI